jgi:DNA-binding GntR family transcriptional regulator
VAQKKRERVQDEKDKIRKEIEEKILSGELTPGEVSLDELVAMRAKQEMTVADMVRLGE